MVKSKSLVAVLACVLALCMALAGCGASEDEKAAAKAAFAGTWNLVEMDQNGEVTPRDDIDMLQSFGFQIYLNLNEDDTAQLMVFGDPKDGTWEASSTTEGTIVLDDQPVAMTIADSQLTLTQDTSVLTFERAEPSTGDSTEGSASGSASASASASEGASSSSSAA